MVSPIYFGWQCTARPDVMKIRQTRWAISTVGYKQTGVQTKCQRVGKNRSLHRSAYIFLFSVISYCLNMNYLAEPTIKQVMFFIIKI